MTEERDVAGIRCSGVLELMPDYLDSALEPTLRAQLEAHVRGCEWCARFGGTYAAAVAALRQRLEQPEAVPPATRAALRDRLAREGILR
jgi:anti-sigma factor RsiW